MLHERRPRAHDRNEEHYHDCESARDLVTPRLQLAIGLVDKPRRAEQRVTRDQPGRRRETEPCNPTPQSADVATVAYVKPFDETPEQRALRDRRHQRSDTERQPPGQLAPCLRA